MGKRDEKIFKKGQKLLRRVGTKLIPVTFLMPGPRLAHPVGKDTVTRAPKTAIVVLEDGAVVAVPVAELEAAGSNGMT